MVSFFYGDQSKAWGFDPRDRGSSRVLHFPAGTELVRTENPPGVPEDAPFAPCTPRVSPQLTMPPWASADIDRFALTAEEREAYFEFSDWAQPEEGTVHRLLGHPDPIQGDMQLESQLASNGLYVGDPTGYEKAEAERLKPGATDWRMLLQIDSDDQMRTMWGDVGRVYFWIRDEDLAAQRFDAGWQILQCC